MKTDYSMRMGGGRGGIINNLLGAKEREREAHSPVMRVIIGLMRVGKLQAVQS
jgi:hypothetical protein